MPGHSKFLALFINSVHKFQINFIVTYNFNLSIQYFSPVSLIDFLNLIVLLMAI